MLSRRKFLYTCCIAASGTPAILSLPNASAKSSYPVNGGDVDIFYKLSAFLTERPVLNQFVSIRALTLLSEEDKTFLVNMRDLWNEIQKAGSKSVDQLSNAEIYQQPLMKATAQKILSAWYLGYTGNKISWRAVDDTQLVTYTGALMYEATRNATVIPTYSQGMTNYWVKPPASLLND